MSFEKRLRRGVRTRAAALCAFGGLGGTVAVLIAALAGKVSGDEDAVGWVRFPLAVFLSVLAIALYEGWRRQHLAVVKLWLASGGAALLATIASIVASTIVLGGEQSSTPVRTLAFGMFTMLACAGIGLFEIKSRPRTFWIQLVVGATLGGLSYAVVDRLLSTTTTDPAIAALGAAVALSIAMVMVIVPAILGDVYLYVIEAENQRSLAKYNALDCGYWMFTGDQQQIDIVDGSVNAATDPSKIWIPEPLMPRLAIIARDVSGHPRVRLDPSNTDSYGVGRVSIVRSTNEEIVSDEPKRLEDGDVVTVGTVKLKVKIGRIGLLALTAAIGAGVVGTPIRAEGQTVKTTLSWAQCPKEEYGQIDRPIAVIGYAPIGDAPALQFEGLVVHERHPKSNTVTAHQFADGGAGSPRAFSILGERKPKAGAPQSSHVLALLDASCSMDADDAPNQRTRWAYLRQMWTNSLAGSTDTFAAFPFACGFPKRQGLANVTFRDGHSAFSGFDQTRPAGSWAGDDLAIELGEDDTAVFAATIDSATHLLERRRNLGERAPPFALYVFTDGWNDDADCGLETRPSCEQFRRAIEQACAWNVQVSFYVAGTKPEANAVSVESCLPPGYSCSPLACPSYCSRAAFDTVAEEFDLPSKGYLIFATAAGEDLLDYTEFTLNVAGVDVSSPIARSMKWATGGKNAFVLDPARSLPNSNDKIDAGTIRRVCGQDETGEATTVSLQGRTPWVYWPGVIFFGAASGAIVARNLVQKAKLKQTASRDAEKKTL